MYTVKMIVSDYMEHTLEEEKGWNHLWEYLKIILPHVGFESYLNEPYIKEIVDCANTPKYEVGPGDSV